MRTVAFIPVRGGSKSIPKKNIKYLAGRPLLHWTLEAALDAQCIDVVYVSSDSDAILEVARAFGDERVLPVQRPAEWATDTASTEDALLDFAQKFEFDRVVLIQATSPLTSAADIDGAMQKMNEQKADSLVTVTHEHRFRWKKDSAGGVLADNYDPRARPRRQDWEGELIENGAFYITSRDGLLRSSCRLNGQVAYWKMPVHTAFEIDTPDDWEILGTLVTARKGQVHDKIGPFKLLVTDVDGVLTDAGMYYGPEGEALKKFNTRDGMGTAIWRESGRDIAIVTGEDSLAVARRAEKLKIEELHLGVKDKLPLVRHLANARGISMQEVAYMGDDLNDLEVMQEVGFAACPADAHSRIRGISRLVTQKKGGEGCLREVVDWLLAHLGQTSEVTAAKAADT